MHQHKIQLALSVIIGVAFAVYVVFQARFFIVGPTLILNEPHQSRQEANTIPVRGMVTHAIEITVNGFPIDTDRTGNFDHSLVIPDGYSILTVTARDRYGRTKTVSRELFLESTYGISEESH